jgi:hypothetical protein
MGHHTLVRVISVAFVEGEVLTGNKSGAILQCMDGTQRHIAGSCGCGLLMDAEDAGCMRPVRPGAVSPHKLRDRGAVGLLGSTHGTESAGLIR